MLQQPDPHLFDLPLTHQQFLEDLLSDWWQPDSLQIKNQHLSKASQQ
jgi:hypothetical protein